MFKFDTQKIHSSQIVCWGLYKRIDYERSGIRLQNIDSSWDINVDPSTDAINPGFLKIP